MKLKFSINYRTEWGQHLSVCLCYVARDKSERSENLLMSTQDGDNWEAETSLVDSRRSPVESLSYAYTVVDGEGKELRREWDLVPRRYPFDASKSYVFIDQWRDVPLHSHLYSSAYRVTTSSPAPSEKQEEQPLPLFRKTVLFRVLAPQLQKGQALGLVGSHPALGDWNPARYLAMQHLGQNEWGLTLNVDWIGLPIAYKYVVVNADSHELVAWEEGDNREVPQLPDEGQVLVLTGEALRLQEKTWRLSGVCVPVFSLRSEHSFGVGDFADLQRFVDWAAHVGMKVVQLLPVNDTTCSHRWGDSYPYNIVSAFALHPHYISIEQLGQLSSKKKNTDYRRQQRELNALPYSDYEAVERVKMAYVYELFLEHGEQTLATDQFQQWKEENSWWLDAYVAWKLQREPSEDEQQQRCFIAYVQYHLHCQLKAAADHARSLGVLLKGDMPVGVNATSAETQQHPEFFNMLAQTGAPPDAFSLNGQNWGFPTYCWQSESEDVSIYDWFSRRLKWMEQYFDALRVDHVLGYFRIWEIPSEQLSGTMGHFSPALPLTPADIEYYGLSFRKDFLTRPLVNDKVIERLFGIHAGYVRDTFLVSKPYGLYDLKEEVSTQRKVQALFAGRTDENSLWIRDGLYQLVANVLFLEDPRQPDMYHPRIQAFREPVFEALNMEERDAYMRLYNNYFYQRHSMFWGKTGYDRLTAIFRNTHLLVCAEDLGMQPDCVAPVLDALRILTLEIQQLPRQSGVEFTHLDGNPVRSVTTISTHDMSPLRMWWEDQPARTQRYYTTMLQKVGRAPEHLPAHIAEEIIARHLYCPSMLCVLALQDWLAMDSELRSKNPKEERINVPGDPFNQWKWRMHLTFEELMAADRFNSKLKTMIVRSKR